MIGWLGVVGAWIFCLIPERELTIRNGYHTSRYRNASNTVGIRSDGGQLAIELLGP